MNDLCGNHGERITKNESCIEAIKRERTHRFNEMRCEAQELWATTKSKLSTATFTWSIGLLILIFSGVMAAQWNVLLSINKKVNAIAEDMAYFKGKLEQRGTNENKDRQIANF